MSERLHYCDSCRHRATVRTVRLRATGKVTFKQDKLKPHYEIMELCKACRKKLFGNWSYGEWPSK